MLPTLRTSEGAGALTEGQEARATGVIRHPRTGLDLHNNANNKMEKTATLGQSTKKGACNPLSEHARNYVK